MAFGNRTYTGPLPARDIERLLFEEAEIEPRELPTSDILKTRQEQLVEMLLNWDEDLEAQILAENFYLDKSREHRMNELEDIFAEAGAFEQVGELDPSNQLRGSFSIETENGVIFCYFTLSPERDPKIQQLYVEFEGGD